MAESIGRCCGCVDDEEEQVPVKDRKCVMASTVTPSNGEVVKQPLPSDQDMSNRIDATYKG